MLVDLRRRGVDMAIELSTLPINAEVLAMGSSAESYALSGGEDYELLFTAKEPPPFSCCSHWCCFGG